MAQFIYLKDVATLSLDAEKCFGCGMCLEVCPQGVLARDNGKIRIKDRDARAWNVALAPKTALPKLLRFASA